MYKLGLNEEELEDFKKRVRHELYEREWNLIDLSKAIKYSPNTVRQFMSTYKHNSKFVAYAISECLGLELKKK